MNDHRIARVEALFVEASELGPDERKDFLLRVSQDDPAVAADVCSLLAFDTPEDGFLLSPIVRPEAEGGSVGAHTSRERATTPTRIGRYRILHPIAAGGMGTVYAAEQDHPQRTVALKVMKRGVASRSALRRFEHESQILARLHHPGIAQVYDVGVYDDGPASGRADDEGGTPGGVPYFVMEYIPEARPLTEYARSEALGTRERLQLLSSVRDAVQYGHQKGIIHRDLKPGNILVDDSGSSKIIDFGVARSTDSDIAITTMGTDVGQLVGTLAYMSPEQCAADPDDLDTRSDVYGLGVVLYELLCDQLPYDLGSVPFPEAARMIREETPAKPSTVNRALRGDVETIALKALAKDRDRRYQSAADLGRDIDRYLRGEAIEARPPSAAYRLRTFARRHKVACAVLAMLVVAVPALATATVIATTSAERARDAQLEAETAKGEAVSAQLEAEAITDLLTKSLVSADPFRGGREDFLVTAAMEQAIAELDGGQLLIPPRIEVALRETIAELLEGNWRFEQAVEQAERALEITRTLHPGNHPDVAYSLNFLAFRLDWAKRYTEALSTWQAHLEMRKRLFPDDDMKVATATHNVAFALCQAGRPDKAIPLYEATLATKRRHFHDRDHPKLAQARESLASALAEAGREGEALPLAEEALEMYGRIHGVQDGPGHYFFALCQDWVGRCLYALGRVDEALEKHQSSREMTEGLHGPDHQRGDWSRSNVAFCLEALGRSEEALLMFQARLERLEGLLPGSADSPMFVGTHQGLALCLLSLDRPADALRHAREALEILRRRLNVDTRRTAALLTLVASCLAALDQPEEALPTYEEAMEINQRVLPSGHPDALRTQIGMARTLVTLGRYDNAEPLLLDAAVHCERSDAVRRWHWRTVVQESVRLYEAWHAAEPHQGYGGEAAEWRARMTEEVTSGRSFIMHVRGTH